MPNAAPGGAAPSMSSKAGVGTSSIYMTIATILFVISLLSVGGAYLAKVYFVRAQEGLKTQLAAREKEFNIEQISLMKAQSKKIVLAEQLMNNHLAMSKLFSVISLFTAENIRFLSLDLTVPVGTPGSIQMALSGYGKDFASVAFQSDVLNSLEKYNLRSVVKNPIMSSPGLGNNGTVSFGFTASVDPSSFSYSKNIVGAPTGRTENSTDSTTN